MKFCRIDLAQTDYKLYPSVSLAKQISSLELYQQIYIEYCRYKKFPSAMPLFLSTFQDPNSDVYLYYNENHKIVAWSLCRRLDQHNVESVQFAWDYQDPKLELGKRSIEHECARYKQLGCRYLYLGEACEYKSQFQGYQELGPI